MEPPAFA